MLSFASGFAPSRLRVLSRGQELKDPGLPGFGEELLFRGYTQRRLLQRWQPAAAIGVNSVLFAAAHLEPAHVVGVLPIGIWLGVIAWLSGSIWLTILCHTANNAAAVLIINAFPTLAAEPVQLNPTGVAVFAGSGAFVLLSLWVMLRYRAPDELNVPVATVQQIALLPSPPI